MSIVNGLISLECFTRIEVPENGRIGNLKKSIEKNIKCTIKSTKFISSSKNDKNNFPRFKINKRPSFKRRRNNIFIKFSFFFF